MVCSFYVQLARMVRELRSIPREAKRPQAVSLAMALKDLNHQIFGHSKPKCIQNHSNIFKSFGSLNSTSLNHVKKLKCVLFVFILFISVYPFAQGFKHHVCGGCARASIGFQPEGLGVYTDTDMACNDNVVMPR